MVLILHDFRRDRAGTNLRSISHDRQCHREAVAALGVVGRIAAVPACDLSHQSQSEAGVPWATSSGNAVERREQSLTRSRGNHLCAIGHIERGLVAASLDRDLDGRPAMKL